MRPCGGRRGCLRRLLVARGGRDRDTAAAHAVGGVLGLGCVVLLLLLLLLLLLRLRLLRLRLLLCRRWGRRPRHSLHAAEGEAQQSVTATKRSYVRVVTSSRHVAEQSACGATRPMPWHRIIR